MVTYSDAGLELWYGTPDAPAPTGGIVAGDDISIIVGARPAGPANRVTIHYRVDDGLPQEQATILTRTDHEAHTQYFTATLPTIWEGDTVKYVAVLSCAGRRAPDPQTAASWPTQFRLAAPAPIRTAPRRLTPATSTYAVTLEHLVERARHH